MGRPTKLTPDVADAVVRSVADGLPRGTAAALAGVSASVVYNWLRAGRKRQGKRFVQFLHRIQKAEAEAVLARVRQINRAAQSGTWQAAAWWLERRHPEEFGSERRQIRELARQVREVIEQFNRLPRAVGQGEG